MKKHFFEGQSRRRFFEKSASELTGDFSNSQ